MKASNFLYLVALCWQATATPVHDPESTDLVPYLQKDQVTVKVDCNELINQVLRAVNAYPQYTSQAIAVGKKIVLPSVTAFSVCKTFKTEAVDCKYAASSIAGAISLAIVHGFIELNPPNDGATTANKRSEFLHEYVGNYLRSTGADFEIVSVQPLTERREDSLENSMESGHSIELRDVREPGQDIGTDFRITSRLDGSGYVQTTPFTDGSITRRASTQPGYKVAWETSGRTGSKPPQPAVSALGQVVADDWRTRVQAQRDIGDYIGLIDLQSSGKIQFRIIPEDKGFGTNYETVDKCNK
ncbi:hypothetical protein F5Y06DRAFT_296994 [Hypoxylon sp. FL0890]|nr:hypothetical protein F5Y06DRAFT_296994 [Hypoxylon sp. FL0890]